MNLTIHIERLVLDGLPLGAHQASLVRAAIEAELAKLFCEQSHFVTTRGSATLSRLESNAVHFTHNAEPSAIGEQIAQAIHSSISPRTSDRTTSDTHSLLSRTGPGSSKAHAFPSVG